MKEIHCLRSLEWRERLPWQENGMGKEIWGRAQGQSSSVKKGVCAAEPWESGDEEANPARVREGCRQGLGISWLRRVHGELQAGLSLSDYWSQEGGEWVEAGLAGGGMEELEGKRGAGGRWAKRGGRHTGKGEAEGSAQPWWCGTDGGRKTDWGCRRVDEVGTGLVHDMSPPAAISPKCRAGTSQGRSTTHQNLFNAQGVTDQLRGPSHPEVRGERPHLLPLNYI